MKFSDAFGTLSVKDPTFAARGDGTGDDRAAIQACLDAAFGTKASPHGNANRFSNRAVYIPPGQYNIGGPLYLTDITSGRIFGGGQNNTRLQYTGSFSGNTVAQGNLSGATYTLVSAITPLIIANGFSYSQFTDMNLAIDADGANNTVGFYLFWNGVVGSGPTHNLFRNILYEGGTDGMLIGYGSEGLCSETISINCGATRCVHGFRVESQNSLDNMFIGGGTNNCDVGYYIPTGHAHLYNTSSAQNGEDIQTGQEHTTIESCRTESANFVNAENSSAPQTIIGSGQSNNGLAGYFVKLGSVGRVIIEGCVQASTGASDGIINGVAGSRIYLRNNNFVNTLYLSSFTGTVAELDIPVGLVSALPTAATKYKGLRALVTDATVTTFASTVAGSGGNTVPVFCDGTNWKIG